MTIVFAPEKAPKAGDQPYHLTQGWRCFWRFSAMGDDPGGLTQGKTTARRIARAHVLPRASAGATDEEIAEMLHLGLSTVHRARQRFVDEELMVALSRSDQKRPPNLSKLLR